MSTCKSVPQFMYRRPFKFRSSVLGDGGKGKLLILVIMNYRSVKIIFAFTGNLLGYRTQVGKQALLS